MQIPIVPSRSHHQSCSKSAQNNVYLSIENHCYLLTSQLWQRKKIFCIQFPNQNLGFHENFVQHYLLLTNCSALIEYEMSLFRYYLSNQLFNLQYRGYCHRQFYQSIMCINVQRKSRLFKLNPDFQMRTIVSKVIESIYFAINVRPPPLPSFSHI